MDKPVLKILLVDSNATEAAELQQKLAAANGTVFSVETAASLAECMELLGRHKFDAVLADLKVPGSDGIASLKEIIEKASEHSVVVISSVYRESEALETVRAGAQDYLVKKRLNTAALERILLYCIERQCGKRRTAMQYTVSRVLAEYDSIDRAACELLRTLCYYLNSDAGILWNFDRWLGELNCLNFFSVAGQEYQEFESATKAARIAKGQELAGIAWANGTPVCVSDSSLSGDSERVSLARKKGLRSAFAFPIVLGAEILGVIELWSREDQRPDEELLKAATNIGSQVGQFMARKLAEREREEVTNERLAVLDSASEGIYGLDHQGCITFVNRAAAQMLLCKPSEVNGKNSHELFHHSHPDGTPYAHEDCPVARVLTTGQGQRSDKEHFWRTDGTHFAVDYSVFPHVKGGALRGAVVCFSDITERKRMEVRLRHAQKLEAVGSLAAGIAHEINTPIQFIGDNTRFLQESFRDVTKLIKGYECLYDAAKRDGLSPDLLEATAQIGKETDWEYLREEAPKALEQMLDGINRVAGIVRAMKEFSHVDRSQEKTAADINKALQSTLVVARNELKYVAEVTAEYGPLPLVMCHLGDSNQVFLNLLVNAAHAIGDVVKGTERKGQITVSTKSDDEWAEIAISDTGTGIPEVVRGKVFDPFFTTKEVGKGTGQGLALARAIVVEKHGGTLTFQTQVGKGTTFYVRLPVNGVREQQEAVAR